MDNLNKRQVSIALATCNGYKYIGEQIDSLLSQTVKPTEIIVCDDCSTDNTIEILEEYVRKGDIKLYKNETRLGIIKNFKKAVSLCSTQTFIALCDQDDIWVANKLEIQITELNEIGNVEIPAMVYSDLILVDNEMKIINGSFMNNINIQPEKESINSMLFGNFITGCTIMFNQKMREFFLQIPDDIFMHDAWIGMVALTMGKSKFIPLKLVCYRQHGANVTFETNKKKSLLAKQLTNVKYIFSEKNYLQEYFYLAESFLKTFQTNLTESDIFILKRFLSLRNKHFLLKKIKSFISRRYRYTF